MVCFCLRLADVRNPQFALVQSAPDIFCDFERLAVIQQHESQTLKLVISIYLQVIDHHVMPKLMSLRWTALETVGDPCGTKAASWLQQSEVGMFGRGDSFVDCMCSHGQV